MALDRERVNSRRALVHLGRHADSICEVSSTPGHATEHRAVRRPDIRSDASVLSSTGFGRHGAEKKRRSHRSPPWSLDFELDLQEPAGRVRVLPFGLLPIGATPASLLRQFIAQIRG
jgi:hypothetical protein